MQNICKSLVSYCIGDSIKLLTAKWLSGQITLSIIIFDSKQNAMYAIMYSAQLTNAIFIAI